jgi:hypothetical protein
VKPDQLRVGGFNVEPNSPLWGAQLDIKGEIKPGTYAFTELDLEALSLLDFTTQKKVGILGMGKHKEEKLLYLK